MKNMITLVFLSFALFCCSCTGYADGLINYYCEKTADDSAKLVIRNNTEGILVGAVTVAFADEIGNRVDQREISLPDPVQAFSVALVSFSALKSAKKCGAVTYAPAPKTFVADCVSQDGKTFVYANGCWMAFPIKGEIRLSFFDAAGKSLKQDVFFVDSVSDGGFKVIGVRETPESAAYCTVDATKAVSCIDP
jgi:hypothetical protein